MKRNGKWEKVLMMVLILSAFILIILLAAQLGNVKQRDWKPEDETQESTEEQSQEESLTQESQTETTEESTPIEETESFEEEEQGYIIIGDSHIVVTEGMGYSIHGSQVEGVALNRNLFLVHTGLDPAMGTIEWLAGDGADRIEEIIAEHTEISQWNIISMHGTSMVTMPDIKEQYKDRYQNWIDERFHDCHVYIVSLPPLDEKEWVVQHPDMPARSNQDITAFNAYIKDSFPAVFFDYYDWFLERSNAFLDEIHYTGETYCEMFDEIIRTIQQK